MKCQGHSDYPLHGTKITPNEQPLMNPWSRQHNIPLQILANQQVHYLTLTSIGGTKQLHTLNYLLN